MQTTTPHATHAPIGRVSLRPIPAPTPEAPVLAPPATTGSDRIAAAQEKRRANLERAHRVNEERARNELHQIGRAITARASAHELLQFGAEEWLPIAALGIDRTYQRPLRRARALALARAFDPEALGRFHVSRRADGSLWLIDGQHRQEAMRLIDWWDGYTVPCVVYKGLSVADEASMYSRLNNKLTVNARDDFRARLAAGEEVATDVRDRLARLGLKVNLHGGDKKGVRCVGTAEAILLRQPGDFDEVFGILAAAWPDEDHTAAIVGGLAMFVRKFRGEYDRKSFVEQLERVRPASLERQSATAKEFIKNQQGAMAYVFYRTYQHNRRRLRLPDWSERADVRSLDVRVARDVRAAPEAS